MRYLVLIEPSDTGFGAYVPELPGCVAVGATRHEVERLMEEAIELHLEALREAGEPVPLPSSESVVVDVRADQVSN